MRARQAHHRLLAGAAALLLALAGLAAAGTPPARAQTCPPPAASFITSAPATAPRTVALTFDDGPGPFLPQILKILRQYDVRATIFDTGSRDALFPAMTRQVASDGHLLAAHTEPCGSTRATAPAAGPEGSRSAPGGTDFP
jgi:peptidoglycan/xylan/chitin deacetylase (PgdA/CDA1 family)